LLTVPVLDEIKEGNTGLVYQDAREHNITRLEGINGDLFELPLFPVGTLAAASKC
jgi:hypothetical protein